MVLGDDDGPPRGAFWTQLAAHLVTEAVRYLQVLLLAALLIGMASRATWKFLGPFLTAGALSTPLPVGLAFLWNRPAEGSNSLACRLRSYCVSAALVALIYAGVRWGR